MNREVLMLLLRQRWPDSSIPQRRVVARAAGDLVDAGQYRDDVGVALDPQAVVAELADAPAECDLVERWNWWIESLEVAHGGYEPYAVRRWDGTDSE